MATNNELARRLAAAAISYRMGLKSVDYTLKTYITDEVGDGWELVAKTAEAVMAEGVASMFDPSPATRPKLEVLD